MLIPFAINPRVIAFFAAISLTALLPAQALLPDGGFEQGISKWKAFIPAEAKNAGCSFALTTDKPHSGVNAVRLLSHDFARHGFGVQDSFTAKIPATPGEHYRLIAWIRAASETTILPKTPGVLIRLTLLNEQGKDVPEGHFYAGLDGWLGRNLEPPAATKLPTEWTKIEVVIKVPPGVAHIIPTFFVWRTKGLVDFDDISFERVSNTLAPTPVSTSRTPPRPPTPQASAPSSSELLTPAMQAEVFAALDLSIPALELVKSKLARYDYAGAQSALVSYFLSRPGDFWFQSPFIPAHPDPTVTFRSERANNAAVGRVTPSGLAPLWHTFPDNVIDWYHNETRNRPGLAYNREWQWQLCRMSFWSDMADAYRATGDEKYPRAWAVQLRSFLAQCPPPTSTANHENSTWRTIEAGIRMRDSWPAAFQAFLNSPSVTEEDLLLYLHSSISHARYLKSNPSDWGNWLTMEMCGLHTIGTLFPEFKDASSWRRFAIDTLQDSIARQFLPDGAQYELSPGYHIVALDQNGMAIPRLARATGRLNEISNDYIASMEKGYDYLLHLMTPDRSEPRFNDSWPITWLRSTFQNGLLFFPNRDEWRWVATDGAQGHPPATTSRAFPYAGYYVMRSGWEPNAHYIAFDGGPLGYSHSHQDKLNLVFWSYGREILFDSGGGSYENSKWRRYALHTHSHNTVIVDQMPQNRPHRDRDANVARIPNDVIWESTPSFDFAAATYDGPYGTNPSNDSRIATHTRRVLFSKPDLVIVADTLVPNDGAEHTYQARWHLLTTNVSTDPVTRSVITTDSSQPNLAVIPLQSDGLDVRVVTAQEQPELLGWHIRKDKSPQYEAATTVLHTRKGKGNQKFVTLLIPLRPGEKTLFQSFEQISETKIRVSFTDGRLLDVDIPSAPREIVTISPH